MKQATIISAYKALERVSGQQLPLSVSHKLWTLKKKLQPQWDFQMESEKKLFDQYDHEVGPDGSITFPDKEEGKRFVDAYSKLCAELADLDVEMEEKTKILLHADDKLDVSMEDLEALSPFIDFAE